VLDLGVSIDFGHFYAFFGYYNMNALIHRIFVYSEKADLGLEPGKSPIYV